LKNLIIIICLAVAIPLSAQHKIGVRAGLNYSKLKGPMEQGEAYKIGSGFHFGINYTYMLNSNFGLRGELLYIQRGTKQDFFSEDVYNIIRPLNSGRFVETGTVSIKSEISNAYLSIPLTAQYQITKKIELFAGASLDFLIGPSGRGILEFDSKDRPEDISYKQSFDHKYGSDVAGEYNNFLQDVVTIIVDGDKIELPKITGAYYNFTEEQKTGKRFNSFDANIIIGGNYFINPGFYLGARLEYGLMDVTNNAMDYSLRDLDADENYIFRDDKDQSFNISVSFGFRF
jgi:hypothetical protein